MKRLLTLLALACATAASFGATLNPVQLLNPAGSTNGQTIVSTGASTAPGWGNVPVANVTGAAALTGATFTGAVLINYPNATTPLQLTWENNGSSRWQMSNDGTAESGSNSGSNFTLTARTDAGTFLSQPIQVNRATGVTTLTGLAMAGTLTPAQTTGLLGTTTNNNASAGYWGEYVTASGSAVSLTSGTAANITSISLTAGDWDVTGTIQFVPAASTTTSQMFSGVSNTSGANGTFDQTTITRYPLSAGSGSTVLPTPVSRFSLSTTTTIFLVGSASFAVSTMTANGLIRARRVR
jgi:hypothetical protein